MTLTNLRRFYEQVEVATLEAWLREHGWRADPEDPPDSQWCWWRAMSGRVSVLIGQDKRHVDEAIGGVARATGIQPTIILYDLLPASARADFVREILPQVAK